MAAACLAGALAVAGGFAAEAPAPRWRTVTLERAPGDLGKPRPSSSVAITAGAKGKEILLFDGASGELASYLETGAAWSKPVPLKDRLGSAYTPVIFRFAVDGDRVAFAGPRGLDLFKRDTGEHSGSAPVPYHAAGVAAMPGGDWVVNLRSLPIPEVVRAAKERFDGTEPRLVVFDDDLEVVRHGLTDDPKRTGNAAAARALALAATSDRLFAAELANYKVYELDRRLKLRATYRDPRLQLEGGLGLPADDAMQKRYLSEAERQIARTGKDAARAASPAKKESEFFSYQPVIEDIAWDRRSRLLILLLAPGIVNEAGALDLLDPSTGVVTRLLLKLPEGVEGYGPLSQIVVGYKYLWLRNAPGAHPTLRLDRSALELARAVGSLRADRVEAAGR